jgi:hypothetical protein
MPRPYAMAPMDRLLTLSQNSAIRDYYRALLIAPSVQPAKLQAATARTAPTAEAVTPAVVERNLSELIRPEDRMYTSEHLTVSNIYPNPAHDMAEIDYTMGSGIGGASITLLNILGSPVAEYKLDRNERKVRLQTTDLPTGYYFYQLAIEGNKVATKKLLVKHQ